MWRFNPATLLCLSNAGPGFPAAYVLVFFMFNNLRLEVVVHFVNIGGIVDDHCLNFFL
jgi:hypothetical protein